MMLAQSRGRVCKRKPYKPSILTLITTIRSMQQNIHAWCGFGTSAVDWCIKIELFGLNQQRYFWRAKGAALYENNTLPIVRHGGGTVTHCICVASSGTGNTGKVEGRMDATKYQGQNLKTTITKCAKHTSIFTMNYILQDKMKVLLERPSLSPVCARQLNIIREIQAHWTFPNTRFEWVCSIFKLLLSIDPAACTKPLYMPHLILFNFCYEQ